MVNDETFESIKSRAELPRSFLQNFLRNLLDGKVLRPINEFIYQAYKLGLPAIDVENALTNLEYNESGLAFETVIEQMYEHSIKIDKGFYDSALEICEILKLDNQKYIYLKELFKN